MDIQGSLKFTAKPSKGSYGVGVAVDQGVILAGLRGFEMVDVLDRSTGKLLQTVGQARESLWSDVAAAGSNNTVYVVDYITATIKAYRY